MAAIASFVVVKRLCAAAAAAESAETAQKGDDNIPLGRGVKTDVACLF